MFLDTYIYLNEKYILNILQKTSIAVAHCKAGRGLLRVNGKPIENIENEALRLKAMEPVLLLGKQYFGNVDIRISVKGGGHTSQVYGKYKLCSIYSFKCVYNYYISILFLFLSNPSSNC